MSNKYQEALDNLLKFEREHNIRTFGDVVPHPNTDLIQFLVDKEAPVKAKELTTTIFHKTDDDVIGNKEFYCPTCGIYQEAYFTNKFKPQYCSYCGQKLDLGE